jgi:hypothetical protein
VVGLDVKPPSSFAGTELIRLCERSFNAKKKSIEKLLLVPHLVNASKDHEAHGQNGRLKRR